jgi:hypothetical protein
MRVTAFALVVAFVVLGAADAFARQSDLSAVAPQGAKVDADAWRKVAETIPLGSKVKIQTLENKRISGTLMRVDGNAVMVKRNTRRPEPAVTITIDEIARLERDHGGGGMNTAKAAAVGLATGAGVVLSLILFALQFD